MEGLQSVQFLSELDAFREWGTTTSALPSSDWLIVEGIRDILYEAKLAVILVFLSHRRVVIAKATRSFVMRKRAVGGKSGKPAD